MWRHPPSSPGVGDVAEWRFLRGWSDNELRDRLNRLHDLDLNFTLEEIGPESGWRYYYSRALVGRGEPGPPGVGGPFERASMAVADYLFSDPRIVTVHLDPAAPLLGRRMLLEIKIFGLRYLCGVVVGAVLSKEVAGRSVFGFRYDTLDGHIERGFEWFLLGKHHDTGEIFFRIQAVWRPGQFPNWWSRLGFHLFALRYQRAWHRLAYLRLRNIIGSEGLERLPVPGKLLQVGPELPGPGIWEMSPEHLVAPTYAPAEEAEGWERRHEVERGPERRPA